MKPGNLSITGVVAAANALEQALKHDEIDQIERCLDSFAAALTLVLAGLEQLPPSPPHPAKYACTSAAVAADGTAPRAATNSPKRRRSRP